MKIIPEDYDELDRLALQMHKPEYLGNKGNWFYLFRRGMQGTLSRLYTVSTSYDAIHSFISFPLTPIAVEHHLSCVFFGMDSALECFLFSTNAIGWAIDQDKFRNISSADGLRKISLRDILKDKPLGGYIEYFPELTKHYKSNSKLISKIQDQHSVSKHRSMIFTGGTLQMEKASKLIKAYSLLSGEAITKEQITTMSIFAPYSEVILHPEPKAPSGSSNRKPDKLEDIVSAFFNLIHTSFSALLGNLKNTVLL